MKEKFTVIFRSGLAMLLVLCMAVSVLPAAAFAAETDPETEMASAMDQLMALLEKHGFATEGTPVSGTARYALGEGSYYVAMGDGSAMTASYVEELAGQLEVSHNNMAVELRTVEEQVELVQAGGEVAEEIAKADLITLGFGNVTFIDHTIDTLTGEGRELNWTQYVTEEEAAQIKQAIADVTREKLGSSDPQINLALEAFAYDCVSYAMELPVLVEEVRNLNANAVVLVVGMYNPMDGVTITFNGMQMNLSGYIHDLVNVASLNVANYCTDSGNAVYVDAQNVDTVNQKTELGMPDLMGMMMNNCDILNPSETGHAYIKDQIAQTLTIPYADRIYGANRVRTSLGIAEELKKVQGVEKFQTIILASCGGFADALAGSYLAYVKNAPILLVDRSNAVAVKDYVAANLAEGGIIYILGGNAAVPTEIEIKMHEVTNKVKRLSGKVRYDTNLAILREAGVSGQDLLVCTGTNFADSLSASSSGLPILLVENGLKEQQIQYLEETEIRNIIILGGTGAVSSDLENALGSYDVDGEVTRLKGSGRYQTSVEIARYFFGEGQKTVVLAYGHNYPDGLCGGPLAAALGAPIVLTQTSDASVADAYVEDVAYGIILGGEGSAQKPLVTNDTAMDIMEVGKINNRKFVG